MGIEASGAASRPDSDRVAGLLREHGLRATLPRRTVLDVLVRADAADRHLSVEQIAEEIAGQLGEGPDVSTIYRIVASLTELGLVHQTTGDGGAALYRLLGGEATVGHQHHAHLRCQVCGRVQDAPDALLEPLRTDLVGVGFDLDLAGTVLVGTCADCR